MLVLLFAAGAFLVLVPPEGQYNQIGGGRVFEAVWAATYISTFFLLFFRVRGVAAGFLKEFPIVFLPAMALVSVAWSDDPAITFRRGIALLLTVMFGYYIAKRFSFREQLHLLAWVCGISIFFSFPFGMLHITRQGDVIEGAWNGIFGQKNVLGSMMALSVVVFLVLGRAEPERRWRTRLGVLAALVLMALSHSAGAIVITAFMFTVLPLTGILRKSLAKALTGVVLAAIIGSIVLYLLLTNWASFTSALGKSETMSGRLQLWALCVVMALRRLWLGYGYGAFWLGMHGPSWRILRVLPSGLNSRAHNVFLQTWLDLGLAGVGLLAIIFTVYIIRAARVVSRNRQPEAVWPLMVFVFYFVYGMTETSLAGPDSISMMIFCCCAYSASSPLLESAGNLVEQVSMFAKDRTLGADMDSPVRGISSA